MSESRGIVVVGGRDAALESGARRAGVASTNVERMSELSPGLPFGKTLIVEAGTRAPWDLIPAGWHFLERWDAAVPLWRYGVTAGDLGTNDERRRTKEIVRDLRVLVHAVELVFVRDNAAGRALVAAWGEEILRFAQNDMNAHAGRDIGGDKRLAFLRAVYRVKPRLCVLPTSWMAEVQARARQDAAAGRGRGAAERGTAGGRLVTVEIAPGRLAKCRAGDEEKVLAWHRGMMGGRRTRDG